MSKLILIIGTSNSGKSTLAREYIEQHPNTIELSRDDVRYNIFKLPHIIGYVHEADEDDVTNYIDNIAYKAVKEGKDLIISDTNLSYVTRERWLDFSRRHNLSLEFKILYNKFTDMFYKPESNPYLLSDHILKVQYKKFTQFLEEVPIPGVKYTII